MNGQECTMTLVDSRTTEAQAADLRTRLGILSRDNNAVYISVKCNSDYDITM